LVQAGIAMSSSYNEHSPVASCDWGMLFSATWGRGKGSGNDSVTQSQNNPLRDGWLAAWIRACAACGERVVQRNPVDTVPRPKVERTEF